MFSKNVYLQELFKLLFSYWELLADIKNEVLSVHNQYFFKPYISIEDLY